MPKAPPVARVGAQPSAAASNEIKRLEEENFSLRKRLSAQREETRIEQKNVERLRSELAHLKTRASAPKEPESTDSRTQIDKMRADHLDEIRALKRKHQGELEQLKKSHESEVKTLKSEHEAQLAQQNRSAREHEKSSLSGATHDLEELHKEIDDLKAKNTAFRQKNTELREQNGALEKRLHELEAQGPAPAAAAPAAFDDLTELKGVGPKVAQALRAAGITTFRQIASWTEEDIETIAPSIRTTAGRIKKNDWVAEAKRKAG